MTIKNSFPQAFRVEYKFMEHSSQNLPSTRIEYKFLDAKSDTSV